MQQLMQALAASAMWRNKLARWAVICMLVFMLWLVIDTFIRLFWPGLVLVSSFVGAGLFLAMMALFLAVWIQTGRQ